jgi:acyl transferase domain-containing protein/acyl carrier protein
MMNDPSAVAIIGMAGRFPGARDIDEYWHNLSTSVCSITDFEEHELLADGADPDEVRRPGHVPSHGYLPGADRFEPDLFGFNRTEAALLDPQHRLLLETAWNALEDGGHDPRCAPARCGVYVGGRTTEHMIAAHADRRYAAEHGEVLVRILTDRQYLAPWLSYRLGLDGPSITVEAACATSLVAVHLAVQALIAGECDAALAGGVAVDSVRRHGYLYREGGVLSPDGRCRPFDEKAAGTVPGNGVGLVLLRRLDDALADGDPIHAVIRGSAVTNDGRARMGFTAPSVERQSAALAEAWAAAGIDPAAAQYLEAHGTGTALGDPVEFAAMCAALGATGDVECGFGSVKANIGHLDAASGVAGLIKVALMLGHRTLVPTVNLSQPHPDLNLEATRFRLVTQLAAWTPPAGTPRLAGVSSMGIGGANAHVVLSEAPAAPGRRARRPRHEFAGESFGALSLTAAATTTATPATGPAPVETGPALTRAAVLEMIQASLGRDAASDSEVSYISAGGDSLGAVHLAGKLQDDFGVDVPLEIFFEATSLRDLAALIVAEASSADNLLAALLDEAETH